LVALETWLSLKQGHATCPVLSCFGPHSKLGLSEETVGVNGPSLVLNRVLHGDILQILYRLSKVLPLAWRTRPREATCLIVARSAAVVSLFGREGFLWVFILGALFFRFGCPGEKADFIFP
jgi:hypothetical protein